MSVYIVPIGESWNVRAKQSKEKNMRSEEQEEEGKPINQESLEREGIYRITGDIVITTHTSDKIGKRA